MSNSCLNCAYLAGDLRPGIGNCGYQPKIPACGSYAFLESIKLDKPFTDCDCWTIDPLHAEKIKDVEK